MKSFIVFIIGCGLFNPLAFAEDFAQVVSAFEAHDCQDQISNSCFILKTCQVDGGSVRSYINPTNQKLFAVNVLSHHLVQFSKILQEHRAEFISAKQNHLKFHAQMTSSDRIKHRGELHVKSPKLSAHFRRQGRYSHSSLVISEDVPSCVKAGDIQ